MSDMEVALIGIDPEFDGRCGIAQCVCPGHKVRDARLPQNMDARASWMFSGGEEKDV